VLLFLMTASVCLSEPTETIEVSLRTRTGGGITGVVVAHDDHGIVVVRERTPYVFSWRSLEPGSAYAAKRDLLSFKCGGQDKLTAEDRFELGSFALKAGRNDLAAIEFRKVQKLDPSNASRIKSAFDAFRAKQHRDSTKHTNLPGLTGDDVDDGAEDDATGDQGEPSSDVAPILPDVDVAVAGSGPNRATLVMEAYRRFNDEVRRVLGKTMATHESEHFLITTDLPDQEIPQLLQWCESMYAALAREFGKGEGEHVFLAKCPIYCFRSRVRFRKFARHFDGYDARGSIGYTRSIESNGHTHVVLLREGRDEADDDRFACTLVHEGTHAFLHRLHTSRLIPHWVNEGFADLMADRVLGDRCDKQKDAALLARCFMRYDWPIHDMLDSAAPIEVEQYPLAHSVIRFLHERDKKKFIEFIEKLKTGAGIADALASAWDGMTLEKLEKDWRATVWESMEYKQEHDGN